MQRILILGCSGSGKTTLALVLSELTGVPVVHLDKLYWQPGWTKPDERLWQGRLAEVLQRDSWIMDGHFGSTITRRLEVADTAILFDFPTTLCIFRAIKRVLGTWGTVREDMADGCPERFDWEFLRFIWSFRRKRLPGVLMRLEVLRAN